MPPPTRIIDSHIHLWPSSAATPSSHAWMAPDGPLTRQYSTADYLAASQDSPVEGFVYVETDRRLQPDDGSSSNLDSDGSKDENAEAEDVDGQDVKAWAAGPLAELAFLRRLVEGRSADGEEQGFPPQRKHLLKGIVAFAPLDRGEAAFEAYLAEAERVAGPVAWKLVKGWRFLLQGIKEEERFRDVTLGEGMLSALGRLGERWAFDVGVDQRGGGVWQVEGAVEMVRRVGEREGGREVRFVLNHLCKPDMEHSPPETEEQKDAFGRWKKCMERFAEWDNVYMKLSGGFSEIGDQDPKDPWPIEDVVKRMEPWLDVVFRCFPPERIVFGSNWPVDNVRGPGDELSWKNWRAVVEHILDKYHLSDKAKDRVWYGTAVEAYRLDKI